MAVIRQNIGRLFLLFQLEVAFRSYGSCGRVRLVQFDRSPEEELLLNFGSLLLLFSLFFVEFIEIFVDGFVLLL